MGKKIKGYDPCISMLLPKITCISRKVTQKNKFKQQKKKKKGRMISCLQSQRQLAAKFHFKQNPRRN